jgi:glutamate dehydrogenase (NADP+)
MEMVQAKNPSEPTFHQAVHEVAESVLPLYEQHPEFGEARILERIVEPERVLMFRVAWVDDSGMIQVNRGYRIQMNSAIGPYKGGLRFHPSVTLGVLKFLAFEQVFKNALTTLPMGGGKGGSDFDPKGKSDNEVMAFCQAFMSELFRHIGPRTDVPAGDIGVGGREIGFLFGMYKKLRNEFSGVFTGKSPDWGGSLIRPEATGYGNVYFAQEMLATRGEEIKGRSVLISGSGNVAQYCAEKVIQQGGKVVTMSDSDGFIVDRNGIDAEKLAWLMELKNEKRGRISEYTEKFGGEYGDRSNGKSEWHVDGCSLAFPCATQNEVDISEAKAMVANGIIAVSEGANMPCTPEAVTHIQGSGLLYAPGKASNAGGVATSGLEMAQNSAFSYWSREEVDAKLHAIMKNIHGQCTTTAAKYGKPGDYVFGANVAGFLKVARSMLAQGVV